MARHGRGYPIRPRLPGPVRVPRLDRMLGLALGYDARISVSDPFTSGIDLGVWTKLSYGGTWIETGGVIGRNTDGTIAAQMTYTAQQFPVNDVLASVTLRNTSTVSQGVSALGRLDAGDERSYAVLRSANTVKIVLLTAGAINTTLATSSAITSANGDTVSIGVTGGTIRGYLNGVEVVSAAVGTVWGPYVGLYTESAHANGGMDDFTVLSAPGPLKITARKVKTLGLATTADTAQVTAKTKVKKLPYGNLLPADVSTLEVSSGWQASDGLNVTTARSTAQARGGVASLAMTITNTDISDPMGSATHTTAVAVVPGAVVNADAYWRSPTTSGGGRLAIRWYDSGGAFLSQSNGADVFPNAIGAVGSFTKVTASGTAPAGAVLMRVAFEFRASVIASDVHYLDDITLAPELPYEPDSAQPNGRRKVRALGLATETDASLGITRLSGPTTIPLGLATEADSGQALGRQKLKALTQPSESDASQAISRQKVRALGQVVETDQGVTVTRRKVRALGLATESDTPQTLNRQKARALGLASEADSGQLVARLKVKALGLASETGSSLGITSFDQQLVVLGLASETDSGQAVDRRKVKALTQPSEADAGLTLGKIDPIWRTFGQATEADSAQLATRRKVRALGLATEADSGQALSRNKIKALGLASEIDTSLGVAEPGQTVVPLTQPSSSNTAQPLARVKVKALGQAAEADAGQLVTRRKIKSLGLASEADSGQLLTRRKIRVLTQPAETDTALALTKVDPILRVLGQGTESDSAQLLTKRKVRALGLASETDLGQPAARRKTKALTQPAETDTAQPLGQVVTIPLGLVTSSNTGQPLARRKVKALGQASETSSALAFTEVKRKALGLATGTNTALALTKIDPILRTLGIASETDTAQVLTIFDPGLTVRNIGPAVEGDTPQPIARTKRKTLGLATSSNSSLSPTRVSLRTLGQPSETDLARTIDDRDTRLVGFATESDVVQPTNRVKRKTLGQATEVSAVLGMTRVHSRNLGLLVGIEQAQALSKLKRMGLSQASELDSPIAVVNASSYRDISLRVSRGRMHKLFVRVADSRTMEVAPGGKDLVVRSETS